MKKYYAEGALDDQANAYAYSVAQTLVQVLKQCGNDLSRENIIKQAASLKEPRAAAAAARDQDQHERDRFRADRAGAARQVRRRALGAFGELYDAAKK